MSTSGDIVVERHDGRYCTRRATTNQMLIDNYVRRSTRDQLGNHLLDRTDVQILLKRIRKNNKHTVVLKIKDEIISDISSLVFDKIVEALWNNRALYIQNLSKAIGNEQLNNLLELLKKKPIWCINIGETYEVTNDCWRQFCDALIHTSVTHLYVSEHVISIELKNKMRDNIRENRKKHDLHCSIKNLKVIERCTNMWWNPINGVKELKPPAPPKEIEGNEGGKDDNKPEVVLTPFHTAYWQEGVGQGGDKAWRFKCHCGETCSSYENYRYHPVGLMFECANPSCSTWSHVSCVLGSKVTSDELSKMKDVLCITCKTKSRRLSKYLGVSSILELNNPMIKTEDTTTASTTTTTTTAVVGTSSIAPTSQPSRSTANRPGQIKVEWRFKCKCNEVCSSYEMERYHPAGQWFECTMCSIWSHVHCMFGSKTTPQDIETMPQALCNTCLTKQRRIRSYDSIEKVTEGTSTSTGTEVVVDIAINQSRKKKKKKMEEMETTTSCSIVSLHNDSDTTDTTATTGGGGGGGGESEQIGVTTSVCSTASAEPKSLEEVSVKSSTDSLNCNTSSEDTTSVIDDSSVIMCSSTNASCYEEIQHLSIKNSAIPSSSSSSSILNEGEEDNRSSEEEGTSKRKFEAMVCSSI